MNTDIENLKIGNRKSEIINPCVSVSIRGYQFLQRIRNFHRNDSAQVLIISGFMVFVCVIFLISTINTSQSVYRRILVQNAADAAADTALAWQARGLNLVQHLNSMHWWVNSVAYYVEIGSCCSCLAQPIVYAAGQALLGSLFGAAAGAALIAVSEGLEIACEPCPYIDLGQYELADTIEYSQAQIVGNWAAFALRAANNVGRINKVDPFERSYLDYMDQPVYDLFTGLIGNEGANISHMDPNAEPFAPGKSGSLYEHYQGNLMPGVTIYAMPLMEQHWFEAIFDEKSKDPKNLETGTFLGVKKISDDESYPWYLSESLIKTCATTPRMPSGNRHDDDPPNGSELIKDANKWGWQDAYWTGHPKYMTWMCGMTNIVGGILQWGQKPGGPVPEMHYNPDTGQVVSYEHIPSPLGWYLSPGNFGDLHEPSFLAFTSGQVEGELVDHNSDLTADGSGSLIPVQIIGREGTQFGIYH